MHFFNSCYKSLMENHSHYYRLLPFLSLSFDVPKRLSLIRLPGVENDAKIDFLLGIFLNAITLRVETISPGKSLQKAPEKLLNLIATYVNIDNQRENIRLTRCQIIVYHQGFALNTIDICIYIARLLSLSHLYLDSGCPHSSLQRRS